MKVCRLASRKNFVGKCGNLKFNTHIYRKPVKVSKTRVSWEMAIWEFERTIRESVFCVHCSLWIFMVEVPYNSCLLYTSPSPRDRTRSRMPSSA